MKRSNEHYIHFIHVDEDEMSELYGLTYKKRRLIDGCVSDA